MSSMDMYTLRIINFVLVENLMTLRLHTPEIVHSWKWKALNVQNLTNSIEQNPSLEDNSRSAGQITRPLWHPQEPW
jgi:hypothetical protein